MGMYAPLIAEYLRYFHPSDLLIVLNQQLYADPVKYVRLVASHIGAESSVFTKDLLLSKDGTTKTVFAVGYTPCKCSAVRRCDVFHGP